MFLPPRAYVFITCNIVRVLSIIALLLVFSSNIVIMVEDIKAVHKGVSVLTHTDSSGNNELIDCDYFENSTVPNQPAGVFWAVLNRLFIIATTIFLILSEIGWPAKFFTNFLPVLGPDFGVGILGAIQWVTAASILSHHVDDFPLVAGFFLFVIGCLNILLGLIFRSSVKDKRSITSFRNAKAKELLPSSARKDIRILQTSVSSVFDGSGKGGAVGSDRTGGSFGGYGFARQGEKRAAMSGFTLATPAESLPRYHPRPPSVGDSADSHQTHQTERTVSTQAPPMSTRAIRI